MSDISVGSQVVVTANKGVHGTEDTKDFAKGVSAKVIRVLPCVENNVRVKHFQIENESGLCWADEDEIELILES